jgi:hypothetical protein
VIPVLISSNLAHAAAASFPFYTLDSTLAASDCWSQGKVCRGVGRLGSENPTPERHTCVAMQGISLSMISKMATRSSIVAYRIAFGEDFDQLSVAQALYEQDIPLHCAGSHGWMLPNDIV